MVKMSQQLWTEVDEYIAKMIVNSDLALDMAIRASADAGLPPINVTPNQGKLLFLLARIQRARRILEIGTLGGYSTIWLGRALPPSGHLISLEMNPKHAEVARANIHRAGLSKIVDVRLGKALDILPKLATESQGPFDMFFIDADKANIPDYIEWSVKLSRRGSIIVVDNVVRGGRVVDKTSTDENVVGVRHMFEILSNDPRLSTIAIQTVGSKGYDGFAIAQVTNPARSSQPTSR
jgi:predicted O-methyltransferase YrrM